MPAWKLPPLHSARLEIGLALLLLSASLAGGRTPKEAAISLRMFFLLYLLCRLLLRTAQSPRLGMAPEETLYPI